ncbi:hypothetical protein VTO42DRAFT_1913 [Malbranchea cinnamomea]
MSAAHTLIWRSSARWPTTYRCYEWRFHVVFSRWDSKIHGKWTVGLGIGAGETIYDANLWLGSCRFKPYDILLFLPLTVACEGFLKKKKKGVSDDVRACHAFHVRPRVADVFPKFRREACEKLKQGCEWTRDSTGGLLMVHRLMRVARWQQGNKQLSPRY